MDVGSGCSKVWCKVAAYSFVVIYRLRSIYFDTKIANDFVRRKL